MRVMWMMMAALLAQAETISQAERDRLVSNMQKTKKLFLDSVAGLSEEQWKFKAGTDRWSIAECAEHIALSEESLMALARKILDSPATPEKKTAEQAAKDDFLLKAVVDRSRKAQAPEFLRPSGRWATPKDIVAAFVKTRDANIAWVENTEADLRSHLSPHPLLKDADSYQWLLLMSAHSERHTLQINEVKEQAGYPK